MFFLFGSFLSPVLVFRRCKIRMLFAMLFFFLWFSFAIAATPISFRDKTQKTNKSVSQHMKKRG